MGKGRTGRKGRKDEYAGGEWDFQGDLPQLLLDRLRNITPRHTAAFPCISLLDLQETAVHTTYNGEKSESLASRYATILHPGQPIPTTICPQNRYPPTETNCWSYIYLASSKLSLCQIVENRQASIASKPRRTRLVPSLKGIALQFAFLQFCHSAISAIHASSFLRSLSSTANDDSGPVDSAVEIDNPLSFNSKQPILPSLEPKSGGPASFPLGVNGPMKDIPQFPTSLLSMHSRLP